MTIKTLTVVPVVMAGVTYSNTAMGAADTAFEFANDGSTVLVVENGSASPITATADAGSVDGLPITDPAITIAAGVTKIFGPFPPKWFNSTTTGLCTVTIATAAVTVKATALKLGA